MGEISIDPQKTALLIVDMQRVFLERPESSGGKAQERNESNRWEPFYQQIDEVVIPNNVKILEAFRDKKMEVVFAIIQSHKKNGKDRSLVQRSSGFNQLLLPKGSKEAEIVEALSPRDDEVVVTKTTDSAITGTNLRLILGNMGIDTVVVTGVYTDQCISGTVRSLADESFKVWLVEDACMAATAEIQDHALAVLNNIYCHVITTEELLQAVDTHSTE